MASNPLIPAASGVDLTTEFKDIYTVPDNKSRAGIDAATFNNYSGANVTITIRLVQSGVGDIFDEITTNKPIRSEDNFLAPGMIGQALQKGGKIQAKVSVNNSVNAQITVTEIDL